MKHNEHNDELERFYIATCKACTLASSMRDCKACLFRVGLLYKGFDGIKAHDEGELSLSGFIRDKFVERARALKMQENPNLGLTLL